MADGVVTRAREAVLRTGRDREAATQALKAALAAVLALLVTRGAAAYGVGDEQAFLGPYVAVLTVTMTVHRSWTGAARQAVLALLGVLLAFAVGALVPLPLAALALVVVLGLLIGRWRRLRPDGHWVAVTALILLVNGSAGRPQDLAAWALFSVVGAVVGAAVNTFVLPPVHLRDARDAVRSLAGEISEELRGVAAGVREGWTSSDATGWVTRARRLRGAVRGVHDTVWVGRESVRWNPRRRAIVRSDSALVDADTVTRLGRLAERVVQVSVLLGDLADLGDQPADPALAELLNRLAAAVDALYERAGDDLGDEVAGPAERVRELRDDAGTKPADVRNTCLVTIDDALGDLTRRL
ncbi:FUSC family protein [Pseudonocardia sp.]|uniref:FUSC family protein n=1 Tax=Pseudonocardia sp. TaxID=60912 RepID=UPI00261B0215|nr:FUSC family protein [Pseudonocardia sp.]